MSIPISKLDLIVEVQFGHKAETVLFIMSTVILHSPSVHTADLLSFGEMVGRREA